MTSIGRRCRDGNVYSRAVLIARTLSLSRKARKKQNKSVARKRTRTKGSRSHRTRSVSRRLTDAEGESTFCRQRTGHNAGRIHKAAGQESPVTASEDKLLTSDTLFHLTTPVRRSQGCSRHDAARRADRTGGQNGLRWQ